ncbi:MAG: hypothetical protein GY928_33675 [Colwellia sp.]|nr:hypothetical protein [Colwellia sp.]
MSSIFGLDPELIRRWLLLFLVFSATVYGTSLFATRFNLSVNMGQKELSASSFAFGAWSLTSVDFQLATIILLIIGGISRIDGTINPVYLLVLLALSFVFLGNAHWLHVMRSKVFSPTISKIIKYAKDWRGGDLAIPFLIPSLEMSESSQWILAGVIVALIVLMIVSVVINTRNIDKYK